MPVCETCVTIAFPLLKLDNTKYIDKIPGA